MVSFQIGCDPELFLRNRVTKQYVTAHGVIPGTKKEPYKVKSGAIQVDGMAVEFNTDPAKTPEEFIRNVTTVRAELEKMLPLELEMVVKPTVIFDEVYFNECPAEAKLLGCDPDYNAYTGKQNERPTTDKPMRTAAGHIHVGWLKPDEFRDPLDPDHIADCKDVIRQLDAYLGVPSVIWDKDFMRRQLYGNAGCFRPKPYGVEYRTPSCAWLNHPKLMEFVAVTTFKAVNDLFGGTFVGNFYLPFNVQKVLAGTQGTNARMWRDYQYNLPMSPIGQNPGWIPVLERHALQA